MAGGIPNRKDDGLILTFGLGKRLLAPWVPVNGVMGMLEKVRALLVNEAIGMFRRWFGT